jgi:hypothetical protein
MEVTHCIQPVQDKACILFVQIESQRAELKKVVITIEQRPKGPINDTVILEFTHLEATTKQQVEEAQAKIEAFEAELRRLE